MNYFNLGIIVLSILILGLGFLIGFGRGMKRSLLRTIIMVACFVIAFLCKDFVADKIKTIEISGQTIPELITSSLGEDLESLSGNINGLVDGLLNLIVYLLLVFILHLLTLVTVYPICKIFVHKPPIGKKKRLFGGLIGIAMGLIICIFSIAPLTGLIGDVGDVATSVMELTENMPSSKETESDVVMFSNVVYADEEKNDEANKTNKLKEILDKIGVLEFKDSSIGKTYSKVGGWYYNAVSAYEIDGKKTNVHTEVGAISGAVKIVGNIVEIVDDDFVSKITSDEPDFSDLNSKMKELDKVKNSMTDEQLDSLEDLLKTTANALFKDAGGEEGDLNIDFENVDLKSINFESEGKLVEKFINYGNQKGAEEIGVDELIEDLSESTLILPLAVNMDLGGVPLGLKEEVDGAIKKLERERPDVKPETINQLKELFGIETN